jgi:hypothetical protein
VEYYPRTWYSKPSLCSDNEGFFVSGANLQFDPAVLEPLIRRIVEETLAALETERAQIGDGRVAYSEAEAAALLGLQPFQLRDERLKGRVEASVGPQRRVMDTRRQLLNYLAARRWTQESSNGRHKK